MRSVDGQPSVRNEVGEGALCAWWGNRSPRLHFGEAANANAHAQSIHGKRELRSYCPNPCADEYSTAYRAEQVPLYDQRRHERKSSNRLPNTEVWQIW